MKVLGLDYGQKRIGYAIGDTNLKMAFGRDLIENRGFEYVFSEINKIIKNENISRIIVGLPKFLDGQITSQTEMTQSFVQKMKEKIDLEIIYQDERLTTAEATKNLYLQNFKAKNQTGKKDVISAEIILQKYLDCLDTIE